MQPFKGVQSLNRIQKAKKSKSKKAMVFSLQEVQLMTTQGKMCIIWTISKMNTPILKKVIEVVNN